MASITTEAAAGWSAELKKIAAWVAISCPKTRQPNGVAGCRGPGAAGNGGPVRGATDPDGAGGRAAGLGLGTPKSAARRSHHESMRIATDSAQADAEKPRCRAPPRKNRRASNGTSEAAPARALRSADRSASLRQVGLPTVHARQHQREVSLGLMRNFSVNSRTFRCCALGIRAKASRNSLAIATVGMVHLIFVRSESRRHWQLARRRSNLAHETSSLPRLARATPRPPACLARPFPLPHRPDPPDPATQSLSRAQHGRTAGDGFPGESGFGGQTGSVGGFDDSGQSLPRGKRHAHEPRPVQLRVTGHLPEIERVDDVAHDHVAAR
jgi:hypothetical protein